VCGVMWWGLQPLTLSADGVGGEVSTRHAQCTALTTCCHTHMTRTGSQQLCWEARCSACCRVVEEPSAWEPSAWEPSCAARCSTANTEHHSRHSLQAPGCSVDNTRHHQGIKALCRPLTRKHLHTLRLQPAGPPGHRSTQSVQSSSHIPLSSLDLGQHLLQLHCPD
jgi:hypothetical protein